MVAGVTAQIDINIQARLDGANDLGSPRFTANIEKLIAFAAGISNDNQADLLFADDRTLADGATENLDMSGVLLTPLNQSIAFAEVTAIYIEALAANTTNLTFFGAAANFFNGPLSGTTPALTLKPGDAALLTSKDGWPVTAATADLLKVLNAAGAAATYKILIIGRSVQT